jgi:hypothetical protein
MENEQKQFVSDFSEEKISTMKLVEYIQVNRDKKWHFVIGWKERSIGSEASKDPKPRSLVSL